MQTTTMIDLTHLRLFTMGDQSTEKMMLNEIAIELKAESSKISQLVAAQDWSQLARVAHKLKTTLPFIGHTELIALNAKVENACRNSVDIDLVPTWCSTFNSILPEVIQELEATIEA
jgi:HPt (histidine-containing phosphotransfer) domain-containing protein